MYIFFYILYIHHAISTTEHLDAKASKLKKRITFLFIYTLVRVEHTIYEIHGESKL
jgi:hypothetical protein